jgi:hypothetical protein
VKFWCLMACGGEEAQPTGVPMTCRRDYMMLNNNNNENKYMCNTNSDSESRSSEDDASVDAKNYQTYSYLADGLNLQQMQYGQQYESTAASFHQPNGTCEKKKIRGGGKCVSPTIQTPTIHPSISHTAFSSSSNIDCHPHLSVTTIWFC